MLEVMSMMSRNSDLVMEATLPLEKSRRTRCHWTERRGDLHALQRDRTKLRVN